MANDDNTPADQIWPGLDLGDLCDDDDDDDEGDDPEWTDEEMVGELVPAHDDHLPGSETDLDWDDDPVTDAWRDASKSQRAALLQDADFQQWLFDNPDFQQLLANKGITIASQRPMAESAPRDTANGRLAKRAAEIAALLYP